MKCAFPVEKVCFGLFDHLIPINSIIVVHGMHLMLRECSNIVLKLARDAHNFGAVLEKKSTLITKFEQMWCKWAQMFLFTFWFLFYIEYQRMYILINVYKQQQKKISRSKCNISVEVQSIQTRKWRKKNCWNIHPLWLWSFDRYV